MEISLRCLPSIRLNPGHHLHNSCAEVYLYLVNYAESNSDLAILAISTLQKVSRENPGLLKVKY